MIEFVGTDFSSGPVHVASSFAERLKGLRNSRCRHGLLLPVRSVHGHGLVSSIRVIALDGTDRVVSTGMLHPGFHRFRTRSGVAILELWTPGGVPTVGAVLHRVPSVA